MSETGPDSLVLRYLRRIDENVSRMGEDLRDLKVRVTSLEEAVVGTKRRLDLADAPR